MPRPITVPPDFHNAPNRSQQLPPRPRNPYVRHEASATVGDGSNTAVAAARPPPFHLTSRREPSSLPPLLPLDQDEPPIDGDIADDIQYDTLEDMLQDASSKVWGLAALRPIQIEALRMLIDPAVCASKLLFVARTGIGKTHVFRMIGTVLGGIAVNIIPLLSLSGTQMEKIKSAAQQFGSVEAHHLDELPQGSDVLERDIIPRLNEITQASSSTVYLFVSPQYLIHHPSLINALDRATRHHALSSLCIDEAHLFVMHHPFRLPIRMLADTFFKRIFDPAHPECHPTFFAMTATMTPTFIKTLERLTTILLPEERRLWPSKSHFEQRNIKMECIVNTSYTLKGMARVVGVLTNSVVGEDHANNECVLVLVSTKTLATHLVQYLEDKLNKIRCSVDVVCVHGDLSKFEKFEFTRLFCNDIEYENYNPRVMIATPAANLGFDKPDLMELV